MTNLLKDKFLYKRVNPSTAISLVEGFEGVPRLKGSKALLDSQYKYWVGDE